MNRFLLLFLFLVSWIEIGCMRIPSANENCVNLIVEERINKNVPWIQDSKEADPIACFVQELLSHDLTLDVALQVALLNNPQIQAIFEEIGIARADFIEASLFSNPVIEGLVRFPDKKNLKTNIELSAIQSFLDFFLIPLRRHVAEAEFQKVQLKIAHAVLNLAFDVEETYYSLQAIQAKLKLMQPIVELTESATQLAYGQKQQGNINELEYQGRLNELLEIKVDYSKTQSEWIRLREKMNKLLGLYVDDDSWRICTKLSKIPALELPMECLEEVALTQRLDLHMLGWETERIARTFGIKQWWTYSNALAGISFDKDPEGFKEIGPAFLVELPIFNYGQADRARLRALFRQSINNYEAKQIEIRSEVRSARSRLIINRELVLDYEKRILPLQEQIIALSQRYYNFMTLSVYKLLQAKKQEFQMQINYQFMLRDYWISRVELDRALGGYLYLAILH